MLGRADTAAYANGAKSLKNYQLLATGGTMRRAGTWRKAVLSGPTRIIQFDYDVANRYLIGVQDSQTRIYGTDGTLVATLTTPWLLADLFDLTYAQLGDVVIICHPNYQTQVIKRVSSLSWTVSTFSFESSTSTNQLFQPYDKFVDSSVTVTPSGVSGSITLTASSALFTSSHVGTRFRLYTIEVLITAYTSSTVVTGTVQGTIQGTYDTNPFRTKTNSTLIEVTHVAHGLTTGATISISGANAILTASGGNTIAATELNTTKTITVVDDDLYTFNVTTTASGAVDGGGPNVKFQPSGIATRYWDEQAFSTVRGWPRAVTFHEQRLWFGGSNSKPAGVWSSWINRFYNFSIKDGLENESIQASIGSDQGSAIRHMVSNRHLQIFTGAGEFFCPRQTTQQTLTPGNFVVVRQTPYGSSAVRPAPFDGATLFVQANLRTVREFLYTDSDSSYNSTNISFVAGHLIIGPKEMSVIKGTTQRGEQYAVIVKTDGTLAVFHSARSEKLAGWTPWSLKTGHSVYSVCGLGNSLYMVCYREGGYYLEQLEADDSLSLDCAETYSSGTAQSTWTVNSCYQGKSIAVISGDFYMGAFTPNSSNQITLSDAVTTITVGYSYDTNLETMPPHLQLPQGSQLGDLQRIAQVLVWVESSLSLKLAGQTLILRDVVDNIEAAPSRANGVYKFNLSGYSRQPTVTITQEEPLPVRILAMRYKVVG
jgi:hypothetical protein